MKIIHLLISLLFISIFNIGCATKNVINYEQKFNDKTVYINKLKEEGNAKAFNELGNIYSGKIQNYIEFTNDELALEYYSKAYELEPSNNAIIKDIIELLKREKDINCEKLTFFINEIDSDKYLYLKGDYFSQSVCADKNIKKAIDYYNISLKHNDSNSYLGLGYLYLKEFKDSNKALLNFNKALELENKKAYGYLAEYYRSNGDYQIAYEMAYNGAMKNDIKSLTILSMMYKFGEYVNVNKERSRSFELMSKEKNSNMPIILKAVIYGEDELFDKLRKEENIYNLYQDKQIFKTQEFIKYKKRTSDVEKQYKNREHSYYTLLTYALLAKVKNNFILNTLVNDETSNFINLVDKTEFKVLLETLNNDNYEYNEFVLKLLRKL